ncbi:MAG: hypothetical protein R3344_06655, partial [Acidobacteriota bacterium]|nr:hypothetical protein [Acidobacteriota bacterium]
LSDGVDTSSLYDSWDVMDLIESREDLSVFVIGLNLPMIGGTTGTPKKFLYKLANRTNGKMFDIPTGSRLDKVYLRIREMLENEAILTVADPDPDAGPAKIKVSSLRPNCKIRVFRTADAPVDDPARKPIRGTPPPLPVQYSMPPSGFYAKPQINSATAVMDPACRPPHIPPYASEEDILDAAWHVESDKGMIRGCGLDVTMAYGLVYQPLGLELSALVTSNKWLGLKTRPFEIEIPALLSLPTDPVAAMDALAEQAVVRAGQPVETYELHVPPEMHARPYHDYPELTHGSRFLEMRPRIARALYAHDEYREWVLERLRLEADAAMEALEERYRRQFPDVPDAAIREAARLSEEGQEILLRASAPTEVDLQRHFTAWLGDIPAHALFVRWEIEQINALLRSTSEPELGQAVERWQELRRLFFVPSYARVLTLLTLTHDPATDRIGFWRVILPRPGWLEARIKGYRNHEEYTDLPLDLVPDQPLGLWTVANLEDHRPDLADRVRTSRLTSIDYELTAKPRHHNPQTGFRETRVRMLFEPEDALSHDAGFALVVDLTLDEETGPTLVSVFSQECAGLDDCLETTCGLFEECDVGAGLEPATEEDADDLARLDTANYSSSTERLPNLPGLDSGITVPIGGA